MTASSACSGCGLPIGYGDSIVELQRHIIFLASSRPHVARDASRTIVRLCLPCGWRNLHKIEEAILSALADVAQ